MSMVIVAIVVYLAVAVVFLARAWRREPPAVAVGAAAAWPVILLAWPVLLLAIGVVEVGRAIWPSRANETSR